MDVLRVLRGLSNRTECAKNRLKVRFLFRNVNHSAHPLCAHPHVRLLQICWTKYSQKPHRCDPDAARVTAVALQSLASHCLLADDCLASQRTLLRNAHRVLLTDCSPSSRTTNSALPVALRTAGCALHSRAREHLRSISLEVNEL